MRCAVPNCRNNSSNNIDGLEFHLFPLNLNALHHWVAATGSPNFVPSFTTRICSRHFSPHAYYSSGKLKHNAIPTLDLKLQPDGPKQCAAKDKMKTAKKNKESGPNPLSCILNPETAINDVQLVQESGTAENTNANESSKSQSQTVLTTTTGSNDLALNSKPNLVSTVSSSTCLVPLQPNVQFLKMQMPGMLMVTQNKPLLIAVPMEALQKPQADAAASSQSNSQTKVGPIKLVDVNKLLKSPPKPSEELKEKQPDPPVGNKRNMKKINEAALKKLYSKKRSVPEDPSNVTVSHVLECLRVILPGTFDMARLIPNEKVATLIIKYLELAESSVAQNVIKMNLKVIIDAAKTKEKVFNDDLFHPYLKINDKALELALKKILPPDFSMTDISNELLNCLCITLKQDIYTDGYHILRRKIRRFTKEGLQFNEIINQVTEKKVSIYQPVASTNEKPGSNRPKTNGKSRTNKTPGKNDIHVNELSNGTSSQIKACVNRKSLRLPSNTEVKGSSESKNEANSNRLMRLKNRSRSGQDGRNSKKLRSGVLKFGSSTQLKKPHDMSSDDELVDDPSYSPSTDSCDSLDVETKRIRPDNRHGPRTDKVQDKDENWFYMNKKPTNDSNLDLERKRVLNLQTIINYLEEKHCSANDVLNNFRLLFYLCKYLHIKSKHTNLQKLKTILRLIDDRKINKSNVKQLQDELFPKLKSSPKELSELKPLIGAQNDKKLQLKPVVVLRNLTDYRSDSLWFMTGRKRRTMCNGYGYHNQRVPVCFQQTISLQKYSSETVRKLTNESYKQFRRIVMKKDGDKVVFRLKYNRLGIQSVVFVKDFRNPSVGWVKGTVKKASGTLKYLVKLSSGETWWCLAGQLRPLPKAPEINNSSFNSNSRTPRQVKPKQLFDL